MNREIHWQKDLIPAIVQDADSGRVLMLGYMNPESWAKTQETGLVTFFSRSKQRLWTKGESSGNALELVSHQVDCDGDTILLQAKPRGPTCHLGTTTCFDEGQKSALPPLGFLSELEKVLDQRFTNPEPGRSSYVASLIGRGLDRMAQKVGEEAVETVIAAKNADLGAFEGEAADLLFHLLVLLRAKGSSLPAICQILASRHREIEKKKG